MNNFGVEKLSKFINVANVDAQQDLIVKNLDHLFVLSKKALNNLKVFFQENLVKNDVEFCDQSICETTSNHMQEKIQAGTCKFDQGNKVDALPFHINDEAWLAEYFVTYLKKVEPTVDLDVEAVRNFIQTSPAIKNAQHEFEHKTVKNLIQFYMDKGLKKQNKSKSSRPRIITAYDEIFRNKILCCADGLGINHYHAELALESNADLWRKQNMERTFNEFFYPVMEQPADNENYLAWFNLAKEHRKAWLQCYEFEYGEKHCKAIREAIQLNKNAMTDNMKISRIRYAVMAQELTKFDVKRIKIIKASQQINNAQNIDL